MKQKEVPVTYESGITAALIAKRLKVGQYDEAFKLYDDEVALTAFICGISKEMASEIEPECYEELVAAAREVNEKGFFVYASRRLKMLTERMASMPQRVIAAAASLSTNSSPASHLSPV